MTQKRIAQALDQRETGDVLKFFESFDGILEKNSGNHDCKNLSIDSSDPPCPVQKGQYTKLKLTDDAIHITNIDKSYISMKVGFDLKIQTVDDPNTAKALLLTNVLTRYQTTYSDVVPDQFANDTNLLAAKTLNYLFVGLKSGIHAIDAYRVFSLGKKTDCEQTEALYENAVTYFLKPQQEIQTRPHTYSPFENVQEMNDCVCGAFVDLTPYIITQLPGNGTPTMHYGFEGTIRVEFDVNIPFDDFLPFSGMTMFPNCLFGNLQLELKETIQKNLVVCQVHPKTVWNHYNNQYHYVCTYNVGVSSYLDSIPIWNEFTQIDDPFSFTITANASDVTAESVVTEERKIVVTCLNGQILSCRSNINGFNLKPDVLDALGEAYESKDMIIPAQFIDYQAFSQTVQAAGMKCNTTYTLTNATNIIFTFPRTGNEITVSKNPHFGSFQLQIDNKPFPDKPFSTLETAHTEYNLVNSDLDTLWSPNNAYAHSLTRKEIGPDGKRLRPKCEATNYCLNCATERLSGAGVFCDGITKQSCHISVTTTNLNSTKENPYLYPDGVNKNDVGPLMMVVQDCFWRCTIDKGAEFIINKPHFVEERTGSN